jgi:hypothetical protein
VQQEGNGAGKVHLRRTFPSALYEEDHEESKGYLPETVELRSEVLADLAHGKRTSEMERLIEQCVLLGIPEGYQ